MITQGEHGVPYPFTTNNEGVLNLTGAVVEVDLTKPDGILVTKIAEILDAVNGKCRFVLSSSDLSLQGTYKYQWRAFFESGVIRSMREFDFYVHGSSRASGTGEISETELIPFVRVTEFEALQQLVENLQEEIEALKEGGVVTPPPPTNTAPSVTSSFSLTNVKDNDIISIPYTVVDAQGGTITATLSKDGVTTSQIISTGENSWNVGTLSIGSHILEVKVVDSGGLESNELTFNIEVTASSTPDTVSPVLTMTPGSTFDETQTVVMNSTEPGTIWYTIDGSDPKSSSTRLEYSVPITLTNTVTIWAYAVDLAGNETEAQSATYTKVIPTDTTPPNPATNLTAGTPELNSVRLIWQASDSNDVTGYEVAYSTDGTNFTVASTVNANSYTVSGLIADTNYTFRVVALDGAANRSTPITITTKTKSAGLVKSLHMNGTNAYLRTPTITFTKMIMIYEAEWSGVAGYYIGCRNYTTNPAYASMNAATTDYESLITLSYSYLTSPDLVNLPPLPRQRINKATFDFKGVTMTYNPTIFARDNIASFLKGIIYDIKFYNGDTLVAHYDMGTGGVQDQSGNGYHATLVNGTFVEEPPYEDVITWVGGVENE